MKKLITICLVCVCVLSTVNTVLADDIYPPDWRGLPGTTAQGWDNWNYFPGMPSDWWAANPPTLITGSPWASAYTGASLLSEFEGRTNVIELTGDNQLEFEIPNFINDNPEKFVRIQVTCWPTDGSQYSRPVVNGEFGQLTISNSAGDGSWWIDVWDFHLTPNPDSELIYVNFFNMYGGGTPSYPAYVDQVVIDTICVPEPATICLLGLGALSLIRRKR